MGAGFHADAWAPGRTRDEGWRDGEVGTTTHGVAASTIPWVEALYC